MHKVLIAKRKCSDLWYFKVSIRSKHVDLRNWEKILQFTKGLFWIWFMTFLMLGAAEKLIHSAARCWMLNYMISLYQDIYEHMRIFDKIAHIYERSTIKIDGREKIQDFFSLTYFSFFTRKKITERKPIS